MSSNSSSGFTRAGGPTTNRPDLKRFKLMPSAPHPRDLEKDYDAMRVMIFGEVPPFARIMETLAGLEEEIDHQYSTFDRGVGGEP
jgi:hypothetical protein